MANGNNGSTVTERSSTKCKWAIMIYMAADDAVAIPQTFNFLSEIHELSPLFTLPENERQVRILLQAYTDWHPDNDKTDFHVRRFEIDASLSLQTPVDTPQPFKPMGTAESLREFIDWSRSRCDAENYILFLWGHGTGSGMFDTELEESYNNIVNSKIYKSLTLTDVESGNIIKNVRELTKTDSLYFKDKKKIEVRISFINVLNNRKISDTIIITRRETEYYKKDSIGKNVVYDIVAKSNGSQNLSYDANKLRRYLTPGSTERSNLDALLEKEIRTALRNDEVDILMIMGCCLQMIEFGYELREKATYFIASEELIYFEGYNYIDTFSALWDFPDMDARQLAKRIVQETPLKGTYTDYEKHSLAISCVELPKIKNLVSLIGKISKKIVESGDKELWKIIEATRNQSRHFGEDAYTYSFIDITWFFKNLYEALSVVDKYKKSQLCRLITRLIRYLQMQYIVESWIGSKRSPRIVENRSFGGHGVGIYFPHSKEAHVNNDVLGVFFDRKKKEYANEFTRRNKWNEMIFEYMSKHPLSPTYPLNPDFTTPDEAKIKKDLANVNLRLRRIVANLLLKKDSLKHQVVEG